MGSGPPPISSMTAHELRPGTTWSGPALLNIVFPHEFYLPNNEWMSGGWRPRKLGFLTSRLDLSRLSFAVLSHSVFFILIYYFSQYLHPTSLIEIEMKYLHRFFEDGEVLSLLLRLSCVTRRATDSQHAGAFQACGCCISGVSLPIQFHPIRLVPYTFFKSPTAVFRRGL